MKLKVLKISFSILAAISLAACGSKSSPEPSAHAGAHQHGDIQETTASVTTMPSFLKTQPERTLLIYQIAGYSVDQLKWIPCYCGCGEEAGHKSNLNCFIQEVKPDGSVVWDDHGTRCGVCMEIAATTAKLSKEGKTIKEIRTIIDTQYNKGYAKPTDTLMPS